MKFPLLKLMPLGALIMPMAASAGTDSGLYLGGSIGRSFMEFDEEDPLGGEDFEADDDDNAFKIYGGYTFGMAPLFDLALEVAYVDFGKIEDNSLGRFVDTEVTGWSAFGMAALTFGVVTPFAKTGFINWDAEATLGDFSASDSGTTAGYGVGLRFVLESFSVRAEYESYNVEGFDDISMFTVGAAFTF